MENHLVVSDQNMQSEKKPRKSSAFAVFKSKKEKDEPAQLERSNASRGSMKKASSTPAISDGEKPANKILRAITGGSFRATIRGNKHRPTNLNKGESPFVAGDNSEVKLTGVKDKKEKSPKVAEKKKKKGTPIPVKNNRISTVTKEDIQLLKMSSDMVNETAQETSHLSPKKTSKQVTASPNIENSAKQKPARQKKPVPLLPVNGINETPKTHKLKPLPDGVNLEGLNDAGAGRKKSPKGGEKRRLAEEAGSSMPEKKRKRNSSPKAKPVHPVTPQQKDKGDNPKVWQSAELEYMYDSQEEAKKFFECMIHPVQPGKFFSELWQKKPLLVRRHCSTYNDGWFSTAELDRILTENSLEFGRNIDVVTYQDGKRETHNPGGRAHRSVVWDFYQNDCSVRLLNPQTYTQSVWKNLSVLQEFFGCCVGANVYLTPPGTQGFAPHYDDIEAFILQLEGRKHWRLYNPRTDEEKLPRTSSNNFDESEIGSPILDITLDAGDLLYFPRGTIHQGNCLEDAHSLHITVSCYQKNTWGDLLEKLVPRALSLAMEEDVEFREGLPRDYLNYMGVVNFDKEDTQREAFSKKISELMNKMLQNYLPIDAACDQMGRKYIRDSLPPMITEAEKACSIHGQGKKWDKTNMCVKGDAEIEPDTMIKLIRKGCLRMALEDEEDAVRIYYNLDNARCYHDKEEQFMDIPARLAPDVEHLIHNYPEFVPVESLPSATLEEKLETANMLYEQGLIVSGEPLDADMAD